MLYIVADRRSGVHIQYIVRSYNDLVVVVNSVISELRKRFGDNYVPDICVY